MKDESIVVWDGTSYFVEDSDYPIDYGAIFDEEIVFSGSFEECSGKCNELNEEVYCGKIRNQNYRL
jgi:hypothetical protein